jgi:hypothetical protein
MNEVPKSRVVTTGDQGLVSDTIDEFFRETFEYVLETYNVERMDLEIDSGEISYRKSIITDNRITHLSYNGMTLAGVLETRTLFNHVSYSFFRTLEGLDELRLSKER